MTPERSSSRVKTNSEVLRSRVDELMEGMNGEVAEPKELSLESNRASWFRQLLLFCFRVGGILSWDVVSHKRFPAIYKCSVMLLAVCALTWTLVQTAAAWQAGCLGSGPLCKSPHLSCGQRVSLLSNVLMAAGAVAVLASLGLAQGQKSLNEVASVLQSFAHLHELHDLWMSQVKRDVVGMLSMFTCASIASFSGMLELAMGLPEVPVALVLECIAFLTVDALLMLCIMFLIVVLRLLVILVDVFCFQLVGNLHISEAAHNWNVLQALLRKASTAIQLGLLAFLAVAAFAIPAFMLDYMLLGPCFATLRLQLPHILVVLGVLRTFIMASAVTGKCTRVPPLINSLDFGPATDKDSRNLVEYIQNSAAGFYIFDVCLTTGMVVKFIYVWAVVVFGVVSRDLVQL